MKVPLLLFVRLQSPMVTGKSDGVFYSATARRQSPIVADMQRLWRHNDVIGSAVIAIQNQKDGNGRQSWRTTF